MLTEKVPCDMKKVKIPNAYAFGIFGLSIHKGIETREKKLQKKKNLNYAYCVSRLSTGTGVLSLQRTCMIFRDSSIFVAKSVADLLVHNTHFV